MCGRVNRILAACSAAAILAPTPAPAQEAEEPAERRWVPGLGVTSGVTFQQQESSVQSSCAVGGVGTPAAERVIAIPPCSGGAPINPAGVGPLRPSASGSEWTVAPYVGVDLELMTPVLPIPTRPRLFARGEILPTFASSRKIATEGDPSAVILPTFGGTGALQPPGGYTQAAITGQGSQTLSTVQTLVWGAGMGLAFPFRVQGRELRLKPSFGWIRYEVEVEGLVVRAIKNDRQNLAQLNGQVIRDCTFVPNTVEPTSASCSGIELSASRLQRFDGIGPGLEIEMDAFRWGPIGASLFLGGNAYKILGERSVRFSDSITYPNPTASTPYAAPYGEIPADTYTAEWSFEVDPWLYRAGVGIRFHWLGGLGLE
jgi:hypothetical protein